MLFVDKFCKKQKILHKKLQKINKNLEKSGNKGYNSK